MMLELQSRLADEVREIVKSSFDADLARVVFQYPPRAELGDLALTAPFDLAKQLRRKPRDIAERLASGLAEAEGVRDTQVAGAATSISSSTARRSPSAHTTRTEPSRAPRPKRSARV